VFFGVRMIRPGVRALVEYAAAYLARLEVVRG
jgi:hypothetical protein